MKKLLLCLGLCLSMTTFAQKKEWLDPELNAINRAPASPPNIDPRNPTDKSLQAVRFDPLPS